MPELQPTDLNETLKSLKTYYYWIRRAGVSPWNLAVPALCTAIASLCEGASLALLIPTLQGILTRDLSFMSDIPVLGKIAGFISTFGGSQSLLMTVIIIITFCCAALKIIAQYGAAVLTTAQIKKFANNLRIILFEQLLTFGKLYFDRNNSGQMQQVLTTYVSYVSQTLSSLQGGIYACTTLLIYLVMLVSISWQSTALIIFIFPILFLSLRKIVRLIAQSSKTFVDSYNELGKRINNVLSSMPLIKSYCFEHYELEQFKKHSTNVSLTEYSIEKKALLVDPIQEAILLVFLFAVAGIVSVRLLSAESTQLAGYVVYILVLKRAAALFGTVNSIRSSLAGVSGPLSEIFSIFDPKDKCRVPEGVKEFDRLHSSIECRSLSFNFYTGVQALNEVSLVIPKGQTTALVGESGSGKSTFINLLMRFYDCPQGSILVDQTDIREFTLQSWRKQVALVSQDTFLFNATLRENILYGRTEPITDTELNHILARSRLDIFINGLPDGLNTKVGDRGITLSGGERQRIAIARAILKDVEFLILDEATSALDSVTERLIQDALEDLSKNRTTLVIAHRLSTIQHADQIIVFQKGSIIESGTHDSLLLQKGVYSSLWQHQRSKVQ